MQNRFDWNDGRLLLALLSQKSLLQAGASLGLNASTVSRRLDGLERTLGGRLFDRHPAGVKPTALAEQLAIHAVAMERAAAAFTLAAQGQEAVPEGEVRITAPPGYAEHALAPASMRLLTRYPRLRLTIDAGTQVADLARREADLAIRASRPEEGDLVARKLAPVVPAFLAAPRYARTLGTLRQLSDARWITWGPDLTHIAPARFIESQVPPHAIVLRTSHLGTQVAAAESGLGVVLMDGNIARFRRVVPVKVSDALRERLESARSELWLIGHRALRDVPRIAAVWEFLTEEAERWKALGRPRGSRTQ